MSNQEQVNKNDIDWIKQTLREIKDQTTKTNGRVTALEKDRDKMYGVASVISSIIAMFGAGIGFIISR